MSTSVEGYHYNWGMGKNGSRWIESITLTCSLCGKEFTRLPSRVRRMKRKSNRRSWNKKFFCSRECHNNYNSGHLREIVGDYINTSEHRANLSKAAKKLMSNPIYVGKLKKAGFGRSRVPNRLEIRLGKILNEVSLGDWKYTGDGSFTLGHYVPDFVNCNGKKLIIELFGDYWHGRKGKVKRQVKWDKTEAGRTSIYKSYGFDCLVIWEHELEDEKGVVFKVKEFVNGQA